MVKKANASYSIDASLLAAFNLKCQEEGFNRSRVIEIMMKSFIGLDDENKLYLSSSTTSSGRTDKR